MILLLGIYPTGIPDMLKYVGVKIFIAGLFGRAKTNKPINKHLKKHPSGSLKEVG